MMFISVDLPEPDAPMIATNSPSSMVRVDAAERVHLVVAHDVGPGDVLQPDERRFVHARS